MLQELKVRLKESEEVETRLKELGAVSERETEFTDTYFNQPAGEVLKITEDEEGVSLMALQAEDGKFQITKKESIQNVEEVRKEFSSKYGVRRTLKGQRKYFSLADFKITLNFIEGLGNFLVLTGDHPTKEFIEEKLGVKNPEYITVSFDQL